MNTKTLKLVVRVAGFVLLLCGVMLMGLCFLLIMGTKGAHRVASVGIGLPLYSFFLIALSAYLLSGAPHVVRAITRSR